MQSTAPPDWMFRATALSPPCEGRPRGTLSVLGGDVWRVVFTPDAGTAGEIEEIVFDVKSISFMSRKEGGGFTPENLPEPKSRESRDLGKVQLLALVDEIHLGPKERRDVPGFELHNRLPVTGEVQHTTVAKAKVKPRARSQ